MLNPPPTNDWEWIPNGMLIVLAVAAVIVAIVRGVTM